MIERLKKWLIKRLSGDEPDPTPNFRQTGVHLRVPKPPIRKPESSESAQRTVEFESAGTIENRGPGKNVLIRKKYVREDTGTHDTLKIVDDSLVDSGEESGIDPYNTGRFDRSKNWSNRFRK